MKYIHNNEVVTLPFELDGKYNVGTTLEDAYDGRFVKLSNEQIAFYENNPTASVSEVWNMRITSHERTLTLEDAKRKKIADIERYDTSSAVNNFNLNGMDVWLDKETRVGLMNSTKIEKAAGKETTELWLGTHCLIIDVDRAIAMLSALELYALECFNATAQHKYNVEQLKTIEEVENYNYKKYPPKLYLKTEE